MVERREPHENGSVPALHPSAPRVRKGLVVVAVARLVSLLSISPAPRLSQRRRKWMS